jgi:hypothetical protein
VNGSGLTGYAVEQGDEADEAGASDGASQLIPGVRQTVGHSGHWMEGDGCLNSETTTGQ